MEDYKYKYLKYKTKYLQLKAQTGGGYWDDIIDRVSHGKKARGIPLDKRLSIGGELSKLPINKIVGAGIVPYAIDDNGEIHFMIGFDPNRKMWTFFGGHRDPNEPVKINAMREYMEESCEKRKQANCHAINPNLIIDKLNGGECVAIPTLYKRKNMWTIFFFVETPFITDGMRKQNGILKKRVDHTRIQEGEVDAVGWLTRNEMVRRGHRYRGGSIFPPLFNIMDNFEGLGLDGILR